MSNTTDKDGANDPTVAAEFVNGLVTWDFTVAANLLHGLGATVAANLVNVIMSSQINDANTLLAELLNVGYERGNTDFTVIVLKTMRTLGLQAAPLIAQGTIKLNTNTYLVNTNAIINKIGNVSIKSQPVTYKLSTASHVNQTNLEAFAGLNFGVLDSDLNGSKNKALNVANGSALSISKKVEVNDTISFNYEFSTTSYDPYSDFAFFSINGNARKIVAVGEDVSDYGNTSGVFNYTITEDDLQKVNDGPSKFVIGIVKAVTETNSEIDISNFSY